MSEDQGETKYLVTPLPSTDRLVAFKVGDREFGFRVPTVGDVEDAGRSYASKCARPSPIETDITINEIGGSFWWRARLELGLVPRKKRDGGTVDSGEKAPGQWLTDLDGVDAREFTAVCDHLAVTVFAPKKKPQTENSGNSAPVPKSV